MLSVNHFVIVLGTQKKHSINVFCYYFSVIIILKILSADRWKSQRRAAGLSGKMWVCFWQIEFNVLVKYSVVPSSNLF